MYDVCCIRHHLKSAISWTILAEIFRRHGDRHSLRVLQTFPGGGQYDCLSLIRLIDRNKGIYADDNTIELGDFNRISGNILALPGPSSDKYPWLAEWLTAGDPATVLDHMSYLFDFDPIRELPPTSRQTFGIRLISALVGSRVMQRDYLDVRMGYIDSSGIGGSGTDKSLREFTALFSDETGQAGMSQAAACWMVYKGDEKQLLGVVRTDGFICSASDCQQAHDLFQTYRTNRNMEPVLFEALAILTS